MAEADPHRTPHRIDTGARFIAAEAAQLNRLFANASTTELMRAVVGEGLVGSVAAVSSFGAESAVLLALVADVDPSLPVLFLDTGKHFPETLAYRDTLVAHLGLTGVQVLRPDPADLAARDNSGLRWSYDPDGCCELRKVRPLAATMPRFDATLTGRKAFQNTSRATLPRFELDVSDTRGRLKINPLIDWSAADLARFAATRGLPAHPLVAQGYPSIGCSPCTRAVQPGEDPRAGRWAGWDKTECGIHRAGEEPFL